MTDFPPIEGRDRWSKNVSVTLQATVINAWAIIDRRRSGQQVLARLAATAGLATIQVMRRWL
jgi:hypothetical protein